MVVSDWEPSAPLASSHFVRPVHDARPGRAGPGMLLATSPETRRTTAATRYFHLSAGRRGWPGSSRNLTADRSVARPCSDNAPHGRHLCRPAAPRTNTPPLPPPRVIPLMRMRERASVSGEGSGSGDRLIGDHKPDELRHEDPSDCGNADKSRRLER